MRAKFLRILFAVAAVLAIIGGSSALATAEGSGGFALQVTPSPLTAVVKPGTTTTVDLQIKNQASQAELLKIEPKAFHIDKKTGEAILDADSPSEIGKWVTYSQPSFKLDPGQIMTQKVTFAVPQSAGFSYSFATVISRASPQSAAPGQQSLQGAVAVFTLVNVDRPGAVRKIELEQFTTKKFYEYLPVTFDVKLKNTGNVIVQPFGNIFIQRSPRSTTPIDTLQLNTSKGYVLPDTTRTYLVEWKNGFGVLTPNSSDPAKKQVVWNWNNASNFRFGKYTAKLVAVYNDGQRDVPIEGQVSFWVLPWKLLLVLLVITAIILIGIVTIIKKLGSIPRRVRSKKQETKPHDESE